MVNSICVGDVMNVQRESGDVQSHGDVPGKFSLIESNQFFKLLREKGRSKGEVIADMSAMLICTESRPDCSGRVVELRECLAYVHWTKRQSSKALIERVHPDAFSCLRNVYEKIAQAFLEFQNHIEPFIELLDVLYSVRASRVLFDLFREIALDKDLEDRREKRRTELVALSDSLKSDMKELKAQNLALSTQRGLFGFGSIKQEARAEIERNDIAWSEYNEALQKHSLSLDSLAGEFSRVTPFDVFSKEKGVLRKFLEVSTVEQTERYHNIVSSAQEFLRVVERELGRAAQLGRDLESDLKGLQNSNAATAEQYGLLISAIEASLLGNRKRRDLLQGMRDQEPKGVQTQLGMLAALMRALAEVKADSALAQAGSSVARQTIELMEADAVSQLSRVEGLCDWGLAILTEQCAVVLQALGATAFIEACKLAEFSLDRVGRSVAETTGRDAVAEALAAEELNQDARRILTSLELDATSFRVAGQSLRSGLNDLQATLFSLESRSGSVHQEVREMVRATAEVAAGEGGTGMEEDSKSAGLSEPKSDKKPLGWGD